MSIQYGEVIKIVGSENHPLATSNSFVSLEYQFKLFEIAPIYPSWGLIAGYIINERDNGFCEVITTQIMTLPGVHPINCIGLFPKSTFSPNDNLNWVSTPEILSGYDPYLIRALKRK